jgi:hypothetical protein
VDRQKQRAQNSAQKITQNNSQSHTKGPVTLCEFSTISGVRFSAAVLGALVALVSSDGDSLFSEDPFEDSLNE